MTFVVRRRVSVYNLLVRKMYRLIRTKMGRDRGKDKGCGTMD